MTLSGGWYHKYFTCFLRVNRSPPEISKFSTSHNFSKYSPPRSYFAYFSKKRCVYFCCQVRCKDKRHLVDYNRYNSRSGFFFLVGDECVYFGHCGEFTVLSPSILALMTGGRFDSSRNQLICQIEKKKEKHLIFLKVNLHGT